MRFSLLALLLSVAARFHKTSEARRALEGLAQEIQDLDADASPSRSRSPAHPEARASPRAPR
ncbi:MAG: hypothetical protein KGJ23_04025 [Euryarchaeota archaeon]|nr:hypothetical protein [Euryarchaeota archaeon]MDE1835767.1 hypothetical protein [Euryarchaeota archaeon]MDE1881529.1 hypothetical protein [Euryarchaeota archaeon]MDE2043958.1 hypothetical protein [Thermoplasmata archaeon]